MIEDGRTFGVEIALKNLLRLVERKGVLERGEVVNLLDISLDEIRNSDALTPDGKAEAARAIGGLYLP